MTHTTLRPFNDADWQAFSGAKSAEAHIAYADADGVELIVIADGWDLQLCYEDPDGGSLCWTATMEDKYDAILLGNAILRGAFTVTQMAVSTGEDNVRIERTNGPTPLRSTCRLTSWAADHLIMLLDAIRDEPRAPTSMVASDPAPLPAAVVAAYDALVVLTYDGQPARSALLDVDPKALEQADAARGELVRAFGLPVNRPRSTWVVA